MAQFDMLFVVHFLDSIPVTLVTSLKNLQAHRHLFFTTNLKSYYEPVHEISNNVVCATSKASDQPAHTRSLIEPLLVA